MQWWFDALQEGVTTLGVPLGLALAWRLLGILQLHGCRTSYAAALLRAVGQGQIAAQDAGYSLFSPAGRAVAVKKGAEYLMSTVPTASAVLGIGRDDHAARVSAQIGAMAAAAEAQALPPTTRIPSDTLVPFAPKPPFSPATSS